MPAWKISFNSKNALIEKILESTSTSLEVSIDPRLHHCSDLIKPKYCTRTKFSCYPVRISKVWPEIKSKKKKLPTDMSMIMESSKENVPKGLKVQ